MAETVSKTTAWLAFIRPKTWGVAVAPVIAALTLAAYETGTFDPLVAFFTLTIALLMQIITNMENDIGYTERKAETGNRKGLPRATTNGWISMPTAKKAIRAMMLLALLNTALLVWFGGWVFLLIGVSSILAAYAYMGGPKPIAYTPWGELTVMVFFGLTAVIGTYYLQAHDVSLFSVMLGFALGAVASAVLAINNWRDREHDESINRITMAVFFGPKTFLVLFKAMILLPFVLFTAMALINPAYIAVMLVFAALPKALKVTRDITRYQHYELNQVLFSCVKLELIISVLFALSMIFSIIAVGL